MGILLYALDRYGGGGYVPDRYGGSDWQRHRTQRGSVVLDRYDGSGYVPDRYDGGSSIYYCNDRCGRQ